MSLKMYATASGLIFLAVALGHLLRVFGGLGRFGDGGSVTAVR